MCPDGMLALFKMYNARNRPENAAAHPANPQAVSYKVFFFRCERCRPVCAFLLKPYQTPPHDSLTFQCAQAWLIEPRTQECSYSTYGWPEVPLDSQVCLSQPFVRTPKVKRFRVESRGLFNRDACSIRSERWELGWKPQGCRFEFLSTTAGLTSKYIQFLPRHKNMMMYKNKKIEFSTISQLQIRVFNMQYDGDIINQIAAYSKVITLAVQ